ncbi:MAG: hypothetical protein EB060_12665 [Proteobacteria bacterium]|nr:hypothetical protein [Pseudomonadota bacterium]
MGLLCGGMMMVVVNLVGGGPGDGQEFEVHSIEQERKLQEKKYGEVFFWVYLHSCNPDGSDPHIYIEGHPHDEPDFAPPRKLELWYTQQVAISDFE